MRTTHCEAFFSLRCFEPYPAVQTTDLHPPSAHGLLTVQRPGQIVVQKHPHRLDVVQLDQRTAVGILGEQCRGDPLQIHGGLGHADEEQLHHPVREGNTVGGKLDHTPRRGGVGNGAKGEIPLDAPPVGKIENGVTGLNVGHVLHTRHQVGQVTEQILRGLGGGVGGRRERPEGGDVGEVAGRSFVHAERREQTHVNGRFVGAYGHTGGLPQVGGKPHGGGKIVGAARRNVAQDGTLPQGYLHEPRHRLVEGAVAAAADHRVVALLGGGHGHAGGVAAVHGGGNRHPTVGVGLTAERHGRGGGQYRQRRGRGGGLAGGLPNGLGHGAENGLFLGGLGLTG